MATIICQSELVRRAMAFVLEKLSENPSRSLASLMDEAGMRFNLTPRDAEALEQLLKNCSRESH